MSDGAGDTGVALDLMVTAEVPLPRAYAFRRSGNRVTRVLAGLDPRAKPVRSPCLAYVIRHPAAGAILIDTGMHPDASTHLRRDFGGPMSVLFQGLKTATLSFDEQLRALDVDPSQVERVVMTHLHVDHTSGMRLLGNAEFACAREEWAGTRERLAARNGYVRHHLPPESRMQLVDFHRDSEPYGPFATTIDLLGDGSVRLVFTPGHTAGHMSVLVRLAHGAQVLVVGDAAYTLRNIEQEILPMLTADDEASMRSMREIKAFAQSEPEAIVVPSHDPSAWHALGRVSASAQRALSAAR